MIVGRYTYCRTVYSAQGWTSAEAIWAPQQNPGREQTYVALTRAKESLQILTLNRAALGLSAQTTQAQENAMDLVDAIAERPQPLNPEPAPTQPAEIQQLSLFPGMTDDLERKVKPQREKPARQYPEPAQSDRQTDQPAEQAEPTRAADGVSALSNIAPVRGRFTELAERTRELSEQLERTRRTPERQRSATRADDRIDADPAADDRKLHHESEPTHPTQSESRNSTAAANSGNPGAEATTAEIDRADEPRLEPDQGIYPQASESLEPDSGQPQQSANQHEDVFNHPNDGDRLDESIGDGVSGTIPERSIQPNAGADQWESERSSDSDEQVPEAPKVEDPDAQQIQQHLEIAQSWSDDQLLAIAAAVEDYFRAPPPKPDGAIVQELQTDLKQLRTQHRQLQGLIREQRETLKDLGPARSWRHFLGSNPREVQAAEQRLEQSQSQSMTVASRIHKTESVFASWQAKARTYLEWEGSEKGQQMHQCRAIVQLEPVQERIVQIHQAQEVIRQAQERQRKRQEAMETLRDWKRTAIKLCRPDVYVQRIQEITDEYSKGKPLNENQIERMSQDLVEHREQLRQAQVQKQQQRGISL